MGSALQDDSVGDMASHVRRWERHLRAQNKSPKTIKSYREAANQLAAYLVEEADHDGDPTTVTHADVEEFIAHLNATRSASTGRTRFAALQQLFKWLRVVEHEIDVDPMADLDPPKVGEVQVRPFSFEERQAILDTVPKRSRDFLTRRDRAILYLLIDTGVRRSECANLTLADVHDDGSLTVHGKGDRKRRINATPWSATWRCAASTPRRRPATGCGSPRRARSPPTASTRSWSTAPARPASPTCTPTASATPPPTSGSSAAAPRST